MIQIIGFAIGPRSFTSEDTLELHIHSSRAVISAILSSLARIQGCRPADQGEFTRRAFESGRIDLTEVEGILDLVDAETETQRKLAIGAAAVGYLLLLQLWNDFGLRAVLLWPVGKNAETIRGFKRGHCTMSGDGGSSY
jgi:hypothetical protein